MGIFGNSNLAFVSWVSFKLAFWASLGPEVYQLVANWKIEKEKQRANKNKELEKKMKRKLPHFFSIPILSILILHACYCKPETETHKTFLWIK